MRVIRFSKAINLFFRHFLLLLGNILPIYHSVDNFRVKLYRLSGLKIGKNTRIAGPLIIDLSLSDNTMNYIEIGSDCYINYNCRISANKSRVIIGNHCLIGPNVSFETASHSLSLTGKVRDWIAKPITIGDSVWIGANSLVIAGVTIGDNSVIAAGAVVTKDVQTGSFVGGVPARVLRVDNIEH